MDTSSDLSAGRAPYVPQQGHQMYNRMKFYDKLMDHSGDLNLTVPGHVIDAAFFFPFKGATQTSWMTVFR